MPSPIASLGVGSNLDLSSLLDGLRSSEQTRLTPLENRKSSYDARLTGYGTLQGAIEQFKSASEALSKPALFDKTSVTADTQAFTVSASDQALPGRATVAVDQLASAQSLVAGGRTATDEPIGAGGTITLSVGNGAGQTSESVDINISAGDSSLSGIRDAINAADIGVDASIINDGSDTPYRLVLSSRQTGQESQISASVSEPAGQGVGAGGLLDSAKSGTERSIDRIGARIERTQASIDSTIERYRKQFAELDRTLSNLNSTSAYFTQQLSTLGNSNTGSQNG